MHQPCSLLRSLVTSALIVGMMLAPLPRVSGAASVWRPDDPPTEEIPKAEVTEASDVPLPPENTYTASQQPIMTEAFCLCACLQYKLANCPNMAETDIHGCP